MPPSLTGEIIHPHQKCPRRRRTDHYFLLSASSSPESNTSSLSRCCLWLITASSSSYSSLFSIPSAGEIPTISEGTVSATGCITRDRECCFGELPLLVRNCSSFVVYRLQPTPACNMGYCVGEGVPCPSGLASETGYTPCDCE